MGHIALSLLATICFIGASYGITDCSTGSDTDFVSTLARICPIPVLNTPEETYCCEGGCCTLPKYILSGYRIIILAAVAVVILISLISCCCICACRSGNRRVR